MAGPVYQRSNHLIFPSWHMQFENTKPLLFSQFASSTVYIHTSVFCPYTLKYCTATIYTGISLEYIKQTAAYSVFFPNLRTNVFTQNPVYIAIEVIVAKRFTIVPNRA